MAAYANKRLRVFGAGLIVMAAGQACKHAGSGGAALRGAETPIVVADAAAAPAAAAEQA